MLWPFCHIHSKSAERGGSQMSRAFGDVSPHLCVFGNRTWQAPQNCPGFVFVPCTANVCYKISDPVPSGNGRTLGLTLLRTGSCVGLALRISPPLGLAQTTRIILTTTGRPFTVSKQRFSLRTPQRTLPPRAVSPAEKACFSG